MYYKDENGKKYIVKKSLKELKDLELKNLSKEIKTSKEKFNYCGRTASLALRSLLVRSLGQINNSGSGLA